MRPCAPACGSSSTTSPARWATACSRYRRWRIEAVSRKPNILVIFMDQLRADVCGCYGGWSSATPNLDRLAAGGTVFTQAYLGNT
ncbi:MAG TPA: sulfatase-like hydrolase/transferase [Candidatus Latescibacteria bacterium]|nr:sulfatase-like hydrolase/transferase [Candidatus Latescibacterota bacterium]